MPAAEMAEPFLALKVGPLTCLCLYGNQAPGWGFQDYQELRETDVGSGRYEPFQVGPQPNTPSERHPASSSSSPAPLVPTCTSARRVAVPEATPEAPPEFEEAALDSADAETERRRPESGSDILPRVQVAKSTSLDWVDLILDRMWPKINSAMQKVVIGGFDIKIRSKLPTALKSLCLERFSFGDQHLRVRRVEVWEAPCTRSELRRRGVEIHLRIAMDSDVDILMRIGLLSAGINKLSLKGTLVIRLDPLLDDAPIVGGIVCYFLDPPTIDLTFSGVAQIADSALLASKVRSTIDSLVAGTFVLPNMMGASLVNNEEEVDTAVLKDPKPQGILRVTALRAEGLYGHDFNLFGKPTSDPYLRLLLSADEWMSPVVYKTCDPVWSSDNTHDFLVYDMVQQLSIDVHDWGPLGFDSGDVIGRAKPVMVVEALDCSREPIRLYPASTDFDGELGPGCGALFLDFQWLHITPERLQPEGCVIKVKLDEVFVPSSLAVPAASVVVRIDGKEKSTLVVKNQTVAAAASGAKPPPGKCPPEPAVPDHDELAVEYVLSLALDKAGASSLASKTLEISVVDNSRSTLGSLSVPLKDLIRAPRHALFWDRDSPMRLLSANGAPPVLLEVQLSLNGVAAVDHHEAIQNMRKHRRAMPKKTVVLPCSTPTAPSPASSWTLTRSMSPDTLRGLEHSGTLCANTAESLHWGNAIFARLWPKMALYLQRMVEDPFGGINRKLQAKVPKPFKSLRFTKFHLGSKSPTLGAIKVSQAPARHGQEGMRGVELRLNVQLDSDADIQLTALHVSFGVQKLRLRGELMIRLEPLLDEIPVCGGVVVCFLDQPKVDMEFVKLARVVDNSLLAGTVRNVIDHAISGSLVMPNVVGMRLGSEGQGGVDSALLRTPKPLGVLRVTAIRAEGLPANTISLLAVGATSNPYLKLRLADDEWASSVVPRTCNPVWSVGEQHNFLFFDWRQKLGIEVLEGKSLHYSGAIARAEALPVLEALNDLDSQGGLPLYAPVDTSDNGPEEDVSQPRGRLYLRCEWLILKPGARGSDEWCVVRVKADEVYVPLFLGEEGAMLRARIGRAERVTPLARYTPPKKPDEAMAARKSLQSVAGDDDADPNKIIELEIEFILYLLVKMSDLHAGVLELELTTKKGKSVGKADVAMSEVLQAPNLSKDWCEEGQPRLQMMGPNGAECEAMVHVSVRGLERASRSLLANPEGYSPPE